MTFIWRQLDDYQQAGVDFVVSRPAAALFYEQGTGKTWVTAGVIERLLAVHQTLEAIIIVPLANIKTTWQKLLKTIPGLKVCRSWSRYMRVREGARVLLIHYEALPGIIRRARLRRWNLIVYDESQRLKARGTLASRTARKFKHGDHRLILSGTPIEQQPQDLWAQFRFLDASILGEKWKTFDKRYLQRTGYMGYKRKMRKSMLPKFLERIKPYIMRVTKAEVLDLPPLTFKRIPIQLLGNQRRLYRKFENHMVATLASGTKITSKLAITQLTKLAQICGGFVTTGYVTNKKGRRLRAITEKVGQAKLRKLKAIVKYADRPLVIFCRYRYEVDEIYSTLVNIPGYRVAWLDGTVKPKDRPGIIERFQAGEYSALVCQVKTGGVGIDLYRACVAIVYSTTFSYIDFDQAISRIHRRGQRKPVTIFLLFCQKTVDEDIMLAVQQKQKVAEYVFRAVQQRKKAMGKKDKKSKGETKTEAKADTKTETKTEKKEEAPAFKYGVKDLADKLGTKPASVRVRLRNAGIKKAGKQYGWNSKDELQAVIDQLNTKAKAKATDDDDDNDEDDEDDE